MDEVPLEILIEHIFPEIGNLDNLKKVCSLFNNLIKKNSIYIDTLIKNYDKNYLIIKNEYETDNPTREGSYNIIMMYDAINIIMYDYENILIKDYKKIQTFLSHRFEYNKHSVIKYIKYIDRKRIRLNELRNIYIPFSVSESNYISLFEGMTPQMINKIPNDYSFMNEVVSIIIKKNYRSEFIELIHNNNGADLDNLIIDHNLKEGIMEKIEIYYIIDYLIAIGKNVTIENVKELCSYHTQKCLEKGNKYFAIKTPYYKVSEIRIDTYFIKHNRFYNGIISGLNFTKCPKIDPSKIKQRILNNITSDMFDLLLMAGNNSKFFIAGGFISGFALEEPKYTDMDIYFFGGNTEYQKLIKKFDQKYGCGKIIYDKKVIKYDNANLKFDIIHYKNYKPKDVLYTFDLSCCQIGMYKGEIIATEEFIASAETGIMLPMAKEIHLYRIKKYLNKGWLYNLNTPHYIENIEYRGYEHLKKESLPTKPTNSKSLITIKQI